MSKSKVGIVYLIHFDRPFHHARHYLGFCHDGGLQARIDRHISGDGSRLLAAVVEAGIGFKVVRTWEGSRKFERMLKNKKNSKSLCPCCIAQKGNNK